MWTGGGHDGEQGRGWGQKGELNCEGHDNEQERGQGLNRELNGGGGDQ